jgi:hypothetical protein
MVFPIFSRLYIKRTLRTRFQEVFIFVCNHAFIFLYLYVSGRNNFRKDIFRFIILSTVRTETWPFLFSYFLGYYLEKHKKQCFLGE